MSPKKIFIVDDEEEMLASLSRKLSTDGYEVITATRGREAVQKVKETLPHLLLVDIVLPDIDGPEVVQLLLEDPTVPEIPVIFFPESFREVRAAFILRSKLEVRIIRPLPNLFHMKN